MRDYFLQCSFLGVQGVLYDVHVGEIPLTSLVFEVVYS